MLHRQGFHCREENRRAACRASRSLVFCRLRWLINFSIVLPPHFLQSQLPNSCHPSPSRDHQRYGTIGTARRSSPDRGPICNQVPPAQASPSRTAEAPPGRGAAAVSKTWRQAVPSGGEGRDSEEGSCCGLRAMNAILLDLLLPLIASPSKLLSPAQFKGPDIKDIYK